MATIIEDFVKIWYKNYSKKPGMRETELRKGGTKIKRIGNQIFAKIRLTEKIDPFELYYHFDLNEKKQSFHIRFKYRYDAPFDISKFSEFLSSKYESKKINEIPLKSEWSNRGGRKIMRGLAINENILENKEHSNPEFICDCMEKLIRLTQEKVCEYIKI